jgi:hydroxyacylglutathione hydrolase
MGVDQGEPRPAQADGSMAGAGEGGGEVAVEVALLPILSDNYVMVLHNGTEAVVVDPGVAEPVATWLLQHQLKLIAVLQTHHHRDHIGGTPALLRCWPQAAVVASAADCDRIPFQTRSVADGDVLELLGRRVEVLELPGHTRAHLAFLLPPVPGGQGELFCGDVLFGGGCGRLREGTPEQMHHALQRLASLPAATRIWCAHEYTLANLRWAVGAVDVDAASRRAIANRLAEVEEKRRRGAFTIPSTIGVERATNLFLMVSGPGQLAERRQQKELWSESAAGRDSII